jgi:hypothetical protein
MIDRELSLLAYREAFHSMPVGAVVIPRALPPDAVNALRERIAMRAFREHWLADRGRYAVCHEIDEPELFRALERATGTIVDGRATLMRIRCLRLSQGDYSLYRDDELAGQAARSSEERRTIEATIDASEASSAEAQVVYSLRGHNFFAVPQLSGSLALVERHPGVRRYDRYLNHHMRDRVVYRLRFTLTLAAEQ